MLGKRYGLFFGIDKYPNKNRDGNPKNLKFAFKDANELANILKDKDHGGFETCKVIPEKKATSSRILQEYTDFITDPSHQKDDLLFIYFAGHGSLDKAEELLFIPNNAEFRGNKLKISTVIDVQELAKGLKHTTSNNVIIIFDCCHSGAAGKLLQKIPWPKKINLTVIGAVRISEQSIEIEEFKHSLFTECLKRILNGKNLNTEFISLSQIRSFIPDEIKTLGFEEFTPVFVDHTLNPNIIIAKNPMFGFESKGFIKKCKQYLKYIGYKELNISYKKKPNFFIIKESKMSFKIGVFCLNNIPPYNITHKHIKEFLSLIEEKKKNKELQFGRLITKYDIESDLKEEVEKSNIADHKTIDEIISSIIDVENYIDNVINDYENYEEYRQGERKPIIDIMQRCNLKDYYIDLNCRDSSGKVYEPIDSYFDIWLKDPNRKHITILGDFGTGKSSFGLYFTYKLAKKYKKDPTERIPIFISLKEYEGKFDIEALLLHLVINLYDIEIKNYKAFQEILEAGKLILIFDGFDEMASKIDTNTILKNFKEINKVAVENSKTVLTCRTHFFKSHEEVSEALTDTVEKSRGFEILELIEFNEEQIKELLKRRTETWENIWHNIKITYNLKDLAKRPVFIDMIITTIPDLIERGMIINETILYDKFTNRWFKHEVKHRLSYLDKKEKEFLMQNLAFEMYLNNRKMIEYTELRELVSADFDTKIKSMKDIDILGYDARTCTFLNRDKDGNYKFSHKSFMEFFVAKKVFTEITNEKFENFAKKKLTPEISGFMKNMIKNDKILWKTINWTKGKSVEVAGYAGGNAITLLNLLEVNFKTEDLSNTLLTGADFNGADLTDVNFSSAILYNANLTNTILRNTDFRNADLTEAKLEKVSNISSVAWSRDGKYIACAGDNGFLKVWEDEETNYKEVSLSRSHRDNINSISMHPKKNYLATGGDDNFIKIWDLEIGKEIATLKGIDEKTSVIEWSKDGNYLACCHGLKISIWKSDKWWEKISLKENYNEIKDKESISIQSVSFSLDPDNKYILCLYKGKFNISEREYDFFSDIHIWNIENGEKVFKEENIPIKPKIAYFISTQMFEKLRNFNPRYYYLKKIPLNGNEYCLMISSLDCYFYNNFENFLLSQNLRENRTKLIDENNNQITHETPH